MSRTAAFATFAALAIAAAILAAGCTSGDSAKTTNAPASKPAVTAPAAPATVAQTTCPVMGNKIDKNVYTDYEGKRVYFCCPDCIATFKKDPAKCIKKLADAGVTLEKAPAGAAK